jgi:hypothetical protein
MPTTMRDRKLEDGTVITRKFDYYYVEINRQRYRGQRWMAPNERGIPDEIKEKPGDTIPNGDSEGVAKAAQVGEGLRSLIDKQMDALGLSLSLWRRYLRDCALHGIEPVELHRKLSTGESLADSQKKKEDDGAGAKTDD